MRHLIIGLLTSIVTVSAFANDFAAVLGFRTNSWDTSVTSTTSSGSGKAGLQAGVLGFIDLAQAVALRTGFLYTQRKYSVTVGTSTTDFDFAYFDVPATVMYKFSEYGGIFGGAVLALNASKSCTVSSGTCDTNGVKSSLIGLQFGASFKFAPQMGAELYYEMISGDAYSSTSGTTTSVGKDPKSVVANLLITFE